MDEDFDKEIELVAVRELLAKLDAATPGLTKGLVLSTKEVAMLKRWLPLIEKVLEMKDL